MPSRAASASIASLLTRNWSTVTSIEGRLLMTSARCPRCRRVCRRPARAPHLQQAAACDAPGSARVAQLVPQLRLAPWWLAPWVVLLLHDRQRLLFGQPEAPD